jgi:hypothetical protein
LQAIEMVCGVALGLLALAREGISLAVLRRMEDEDESAENAVVGVREMSGEIEREQEPAPEAAPLPR